MTGLGMQFPLEMMKRFSAWVVSHGVVNVFNVTELCTLQRISSCYKLHLKKSMYTKYIYGNIRIPGIFVR